MSHTSHKILIIDQSTDMIDKIFDLLNDSPLPDDLRVATSLGLDEAKGKLRERAFSLIIARVALHEVSQYQAVLELHGQMPSIGLIEEDSADALIGALRVGFDDLFLVRNFSAESVPFVESVERCLAKARMVDENRFYREELEQSLSELRADQQAAYHIQRNMMPAEEIEVSGIVARHLITPSLYLSGDFVDVVPVDNEMVVFYLADVSGHGASSALVTVLLKNMTQGMVKDYRDLPGDKLPSLADVLRRINAELLETGVGKHLSMFIGAIDRRSGLLHYAVGGHHPMPLITDASGTRYLEGRGMPVGLFEQPLYDERTIELQSPFQVTLFSDGILEVLPHKDMRSREEYVRAVVDNLRGAEPARLKGALMAGYDSEVPDDIAIMTVVGH